MSNIFVLIAVVLFFLAAVNVVLIPNETAWGLFFFALGHLTGIAWPLVKA